MTETMSNPRMGIIVLAGVMCALGACDTPQTRTRPTVTDTRNQTEQSSEKQAVEDPARQPGELQYLPASDDAADVEITETPTSPPTSPSGKNTTDQSADAGAGQPPGSSGASGQGSEPDPARTGPVMNIGGAQTDEERAATLNGQLDANLSAFDRMIRREREALEEAQDAAGGPNGADDGRGQRSEAMEGARGAGGSATVGTGQGNTPDLVGENREGEIKHVATDLVPDDIPDAQDDDIVARQLREAAMKETDPVLSEKLWEEYRKYTKGSTSR